MSGPGSAPADAALARHGGLLEPVSDCPLLDGNRVELLRSGAAAIEAIFDAIEAARDHVHLEYYTMADVASRGRHLFALLERKLAEGVEVAVIWDAVGSGDTPDALFDRLKARGARVLEYRATNPLRRGFSLRLNDRDHRKLTVADGRVAFLGGCNLSKVYETPRSVGRGRDADHAFWIDNAIRIEGPSVAEVQKLFFHTWRRQGGDSQGVDGLRGGPAEAPPRPAPVGEERIRVDGSAPGEHRPLYSEALCAAISGARERILLGTGYFVPTRREWQGLAAAARRGVEVRLLLPGYSDVQAAVHAARALYGKLLAAGVHIHEVRDAMLHAKIGTIDGVWSVVGSSNLDRRSVRFNNEIDAVVLGRRTAEAVEGLLREQMAREAQAVTLAGWQARSWHEHLGEAAARLWKRLM